MASNVIRTNSQNGRKKHFTKKDDEEIRQRKDPPRKPDISVGHVLRHFDLTTTTTTTKTTNDADEMSNQDFVVLTDRGASSSTFNRRCHWRRHTHLSRDDGDAGNVDVDVVDDGDDDDDKFSRKETKPQVFTVFRVSCHNTGDLRVLVFVALQP